MKKSIYLILLLVVFKASAQESIVFKMNYLPEHRYNSIIEMHNNVEVNFKGPKEEQDKLKAEGVQSPMTVAGATSTEYTIQTGVATEEKKFPATIIYSNIISTQFLNNKELSLPESTIGGKKIYAHSDSNDMLHIDSIGGKEGNDSLLSSVSAVFNNVNMQMNFPEKNLKVGESFTQDAPMNLPLFGSNMTATVKVVYTLTKIKDGNGLFDVVQTSNIKANIMQGDINMIVEGTGKLIFSIKNKFPIQYSTDTTLKFTLDMNGIIAEGMGKMSTVHNTEIN